MRTFPYGYSGSYPGIFSTMQIGDQILIQAGCGSPDSPIARVDVIVGIHRLSALTASGIRLCCVDEGGLSPTGHRLEDYEYEVSDEARRLLADAEMRRQEQELE